MFETLDILMAIEAEDQRKTKVRWEEEDHCDPRSEDDWYEAQDILNEFRREFDEFRKQEDYGVTSNRR